MTIDFSTRIEAGVNAVFPDIIVQKCVFHAIQLLIRGLIKEFTKIKKDYLLDHIEEWRELRRYALSLEKGKKTPKTLEFKFEDVKQARQIYVKLRRILSNDDLVQVKHNLRSFLSTPQFAKWEGAREFLSKYDDILRSGKFKFSPKGLKYVVSKIYKAWRAVIRELRKNLEKTKSHFNDIKYLVLMNPINMEPYHSKELRKYLKEFPWLRRYRRILVKFYYQFRLPSEKRTSLNFLSGLLTENSHSWLKSAVQTLIDNEECVFRFQRVPELFPKVKACKSIKVVNESCNKIVNQLYHTQCGMRTIKNIRMRISNRLICPIFISPSLLEKIK